MTKFITKVKHFLTKEKKIWHKHFWPALVAAVVVAVIALFFEVNKSNIIMFASVASSAIVLTNKKRHHLTKLRTVLVSYVLSAIVSFSILILARSYHFKMQFSFFLEIFIVTMILYSFNVFHPPAISGGVSLIISDNLSFSSILFLVFIVLCMLVLVRFAVYFLNRSLSVKEFHKEFKHEKGVGEKSELAT